MHKFWDEMVVGERYPIAFAELAGSGDCAEGLGCWGRGEELREVSRKGGVEK